MIQNSPCRTAYAKHAFSGKLDGGGACKAERLLCPAIRVCSRSGSICLLASWAALAEIADYAVPSFRCCGGHNIVRKQVR